MKKMMGLMAMTCMMSLNSFAISNNLECSLNEPTNTSDISKLRLEYTHDEFNILINVDILNTSGEVVKSYQKARAHAGGRGSGWPIHPELGKISADYRSTDFCVDSEPVIKREGGIFNRRNVIKGYSCITGSQDIVVTEITPEDENIPEYISKVEVTDYALAEQVGTKAYLEFNNCKDL